MSKIFQLQRTISHQTSVFQVRSYNMKRVSFIIILGFANLAHFVFGQGEFKEILCAHIQRLLAIYFKLLLLHFNHSCSLA